MPRAQPMPRAPLVPEPEPAARQPRSRAQRATKAALAVLLGLTLAGLGPGSTALAAGGGGGGGGGSGSSGVPRPAAAPPSRSPQELAARSYERAQEHREDALVYEEKARANDRGLFGIGKPPSEKAGQAWRDAVEDYREAISHDRHLYQAWSDLGFALRRLGNWEESVSAYDTALRIEPTYAPAIEYRGAAYLELSRLAAAKAAYMQLFSLDRALADQLMQRMQQWLEGVDEKPPADLAPERIERFRQWVRERAELAAQASPGLSDARPW